MKQVINRTLYDTEDAEQIARYAPQAELGERYLVQTLYKTSQGEYFLHTTQGWVERYVESIEQRASRGGNISSVSEEEAVDWCEDCGIDAEIILEEFAHLIET